MSPRAATRSQHEADESGAILVFALVFLVAVSLIVTALLTFVGTSLHDSNAFSNERNVESAATNAVNLAIQNTRYNFDTYALLDSASPKSCLPGGYQVSNEQSMISVYCTMVWQPFNAETRTITYSACVNGPSVTATTCAAAPLLQAVIAFGDNQTGVAPSLGPQQCTPISQGGYCGESMTQLSWQWNPLVPVVSAVSPTGGQSSGGTTVTITGSNFTSGATVSFLQESGGNPVNPSNQQGYNPPVSATLVSNPPSNCAPPSSTCLQVTSPTVLSGTTYFVTVTTPGGTSAFSAVFSYNTPTVPTPTVAGLSGSVTSGSITGYSTVTVLGTNFWAPNIATTVLVSFCPVAGGTCQSSPSNGTSGVVVSLPETGSPYESVSALSPPVSAPAAYYVEVEVNNVKSAPNPAAEFNYTVQVPIITSVSPTTPVAPGGTLTINGYNFIPNMTVGFCPYVPNQAPYYDANCVSGGGNSMVTVQPVTANQLVVTVPNMGGTAGIYFPILGLP
ncbi:MAG: IPT/TIG domain-containing protein, partial [Acidimicrobiales bacterium]